VRLRPVLFWYAAITILWACPSLRAAETNQWLGGAGPEWYDWFTPANWSLNRVPTTSDVVVVSFGIVQATPESRFGQLILNSEIFGELHVDTAMDWNSGTVSGSLIITSNGVMRVQDAFYKNLLATNVFNYGRVIVASHEWHWESQVVWHNQPGSLLEVDTLSGPLALSDALNATVLNNGTIRIDSPGDVPWRAALENSGVLQVQSGTLELWDGLLNSGTIAVQSNSLLALKSGTFDLCSGTRTGHVQIRGDIAIAGGKLCGEIDWVAGTIGGNLEIAMDAVVNVRFAGRIPGLADGTSVTNFGTVTLEIGWVWGNGVVWHTAPQGKVTVVRYGNIQSGLSVPKPVFVNEGELVVFDEVDAVVINRGAVTLAGDEDVTFRPGYTQLSGTTRMMGARLTGDVTLEGGTWYGPGHIYGSLTNRARLEIDATVGTLLVFGKYFQGVNGALAVTLNSTGSDILLDRVEASYMQGKLEVSLSNGLPAPGQIFTILRTSVRSGEFEHVSGLGLGNGLRLDVSYDTWTVMLTATRPPQRLTIARGTDGSPAFQFDGDAERPFHFQTSTNLMSWQTILSTNAPTGIIQLIDPDLANYPCRFYRALYP